MSGKTNKGQLIAKVLEPRGSNQVEIELPDGDRRLVLVPSKFHRVVFLKKGDLVIVEMEPNMDKIDGKVVGSLVVPLQKQQVKHLHQQKMIPMRFSSQLDVPEEEKKPTIDDMMPPSGSDDDDEHEGNLNRREQPVDDDSE